MAEPMLKLLIADDEYWVRQSILSLVDWERHGYACLTPAVDGEDAWAKIESERPDIVLMDINMPFLSGIELTRRVRDTYPGTVVIILSGYSDFDNVREAMKQGAVDYLLKPAERDALLHALMEATKTLMKSRAERAQLMALREKSALASSMLQDRELSALLWEAGDGGRALSAQRMRYDLWLASFYLAQIRLPGRWLDAEGVHAMKARLEGAFEVKRKLTFHDVAGQGVFYLILEAERDAVQSACQAALQALTAQHDGPVRILVSARKTSLTQLRAAHSEIQQLRLVRPCSGESRLLFAGERQDVPVVSRIGNRQRRALEMALAAQSQARFWQVVDRDIGLWQGMEGGWLYVELLHTLSAIGHALIGALPRETTGGRAISMDNLMELMLVAADRQDAGEVRSILQEMLAEVIGAPGEAAVSEGMLATIRQVRDHIARHYADDLSLALLAKQFSVDGAHLSRTFKQVTGENLMLSIARTRIERAQALIREGAWNLTEIASMTGYDDYAYFNRVFRKIAGVSPSAYREECQR